MRNLPSMDRQQWATEKCPKEERDPSESAPCYGAWLRAGRWIPAIALRSDLRALLWHRRERSLSVSWCSQVCFLLAGVYPSGLLCSLLWQLSVLFPTSLLAAGFFPCTVLVSTGARIWTGQSTKMHSFLNCHYHSHNYQSVAVPLPRSIYGINTLSKAQWFIHSPQR